MKDLISRQDAVDAMEESKKTYFDRRVIIGKMQDIVNNLPPARQWIPCSNPPKHHRDVLVRGIEAIGNVTVHKVMQWDVDRWRPMNYPPSITWKEWSEI